MEAIVNKTYTEFKEELDREFYTAANSFCKIGYLLRIAKDTDILYTSGYRSLNEFAKAEYGLTADMVSRYIRINEKYSEGGYGESLMPEYEGYGVAKLAEIMTLPDAIAGEVTPDMSKAQIMEIKKQVREEEKTTPVEAALEKAGVEEDSQESMIRKFLYGYFRENREQFQKLFVMQALPHDGIPKALAEILSPSGTAVLTARAQGIGRILLLAKGHGTDMTLVVMRTEEKQAVSWQGFWEEFWLLFDRSLPADEAYREVYADGPETGQTAAGQPEEPETGQPEEQVQDIQKDTNQQEDAGEGAVSQNGAEEAAGQDDPEPVQGEVVQQISQQTAAAAERHLTSAIRHLETAANLLENAGFDEIQRLSVHTASLCRDMIGKIGRLERK